MQKNRLLFVFAMEYVYFYRRFLKKEKGFKRKKNDCISLTYGL